MALSPQEEAVLQELLARRQPETPSHKSVYFFNWTKKDFTHTWDKVPYTVKAGEKQQFPDWLANHLAKHLAERELNDANSELILKQKIAGKEGKDIKEINILFTPLREQYIKACLGEIAFEANSEVELAIKMGNLPPVAQTPEQKEEVKIEVKKRGRPAKKAEDEFEGLADVKEKDEAPATKAD